MAKVKIKATSKDVEAAAKGGDFEQAPVGIYVAELVECTPGYAQEDGKDDKSRPNLQCIWKIVGVGREGEEPSVQYSRLWDYVTFGESAGWKRAEFGLAMGLPLKNGEINGEIETEENKPGTVVGTKALIRVRADKDLQGNYRARIGKISPMDGSALDSTSSAFADAPDDAGPDDPFADAAPAEEEALLTNEELEAMELKELGELAREFDLEPKELIVKTRGKLDTDKTKAAVITAILEAQGGQVDAEADGSAEDPF